MGKPPRRSGRARKTRQPQPTKMYNENGHLVLENGETKDLCDCLEESCPGCHFQCKKCRSPKCGHECRKNRIWTFDTVEHDGAKGVVVRKNPYVDVVKNPSVETRTL